MLHEEWSKEVRKALIDKGESIRDMARSLGYTAEWCRATIYGRDINPGMVSKISEYVGVTNYMEV